MKTLLLLTLVVLFATTTSATDYYFSASSGDDSRTPSQAQSPSTPWKTLSKLNSFFSSLQPGDAVLLKRGETFYGSITVTKSGTASSPIVIGAYGTGNKPTITSLVTLGSWISKGNGIWESYNSSLGSRVNIVLLNGVQQGMGRYPNSDETYDGYLTFESHVGKTSITDNQLTSAINWTGAELVIRSRRWVLDRNLITAHSGGTLSCASTATYEPKNGYGYFIQNSIKTLDKIGEWYYNPSTKKLSVYFGANTPSSYTVSASTIADLIHSEKYSNIVFDNLTIKGANVFNFDITNGSNISIQNCDIMFAGVNGVEVNGQTNFKIENCTIANSNNDGIEFVWGVTSATVRNNKILNTSMIAGTGLNGDGQGVGIYANGDGNIIAYNEIRNTCRNGMSFRGNNVTVSNNLIDSFCLVKDDGAGIYSFGYDAYTGTKIIGNIVMNGIGAVPGTGTSLFSTAGIYIDNNNSRIEIRDNTVTKCHDYGIYVHNSSGLTIKSNTFFNNDKRQLAMIQESDRPSTIRNHTITQNILFSKEASQLVSHIESYTDDITSFGKFDSNYYARPIDDRLTISNIYSGVTKSLDLDGWKNQYGDDPASKRTAKQIAAFKINSLIGSNRVPNGTFTSSTTGTSTYYCSVSLGISGLLDGGYLQISPSTTKSNVSFKIGSITAGKKYILRYSVRGSVDNNMIITSYLRLGTSPYTTISEKQNRKVSTTRSENEIMFIAMFNDPAAAVQLQADLQSKYYLDNIQFYEADAKITNPDDSIRFVYNATKIDKTVALDGSYIDTKGSKFSNSITLLPYASAVLIKNGVTSASNAAPTIDITNPVVNAEFEAPATITINAAASDEDGSIAKVDFYNGSTLLGSDNTSPYSYTWNSVAEGDYSITAKATDNGSLVTTSDAINISVSAPNQAPTVSVTGPAANAKFIAPASITISVAASDADGSIVKVDFYNGNTLLGSDNTSPYSFTWNNVASGSYSLTARATDNGSLVTTSSAISISVTNPNSAPTVNITSPVSGAEFEGPASITVSAMAADIDGSVTKVDFYNGNTLLGSDNTSPFSLTLNNVAAGSYSLTAKATDNGSLVTTSAAVSVSVNNPNSAPSVSITNPITSAKFEAPASITINATAADVDGSITKVDFYNGNILLGSDNTSPYTFTWNNVATGSYSLTAKATDNGSLATASSAVTISIFDPNGAPIVNITSPVTSTSFNAPASITVNATAFDADGSVIKVDFYNGNTLLGSDNTSPYSFTWNNVAAGSYSLTAKATDNGSLVSTSSAVNVSVSNSNVAPTIKIITPETNTIYNGPATVKIVAEANDPDGYITKVEFLRGTNHLYNDYAPPYNCTLTGLKVGNYQISAKVTDNNGVITQSDFVLISVVEPAKAADADSLHTTSDSVSVPELMAKTSLTVNTKVTNVPKDIVGNSLETLSLKIGPNPTSSMLSISTSGMTSNIEMKISVLSITGQVFKTIRSNNSNVHMNVSSLPAGVYLIQAMFGETIIYKRFVKQ